MLSRTAAYRLAAAVVGLGLFASVTPSPLYRSYSVLWSFSPLTLTLIYATYAFGVLSALLVAGRVSDDVGRRPALVVSLAALALATLLFVFADSAAWLFVARGLQGLATGVALSAASAAMLDLHPRRDPASVGLANGVVSAAGLAAGMLVSAALVQAGWEPRVLPYLVLLALELTALALAAAMPEPVVERRPLRLALERPSVAREARRPFLLASLAVLASWSIGGLFFSLGPQLSTEIFGSGDAVVAALGVVALAGSAALSQLLLGRVPPWLGASAGAVGLAAGTLTIVAAAQLQSASVYLVGAVVGGVGFGLAFLGGLRSLVSAIPADRRAATMSAFYVVAYAALSVPAVVAGLVVTHIGLERTFEIFGSVVAGIALVVALEAWRTRPRVLAGAQEAEVAA